VRWEISILLKDAFVIENTALGRFHINSCVLIRNHLLYFNNRSSHRKHFNKGKKTKVQSEYWFFYGGASALVQQKLQLTATRGIFGCAEGSKGSW